MPPPFIHLNPLSLEERDNTPPAQRVAPGDDVLSITNPGALVACLIGGVSVLLLVARLIWWISLQIKTRRPPSRPARRRTRQSWRYRILQQTHEFLPSFISTRLPPPAPSAADNLPPDYPALSIETLPPYPGFNSPSSPADSRRILYLVPIMPMVEMFTRRPVSPAVQAQGSGPALNNASLATLPNGPPLGGPGVALPSEPPPVYDSLTPPYRATLTPTTVAGALNTRIQPRSQEEAHERPQ